MPYESNIFRENWKFWMAYEVINQLLHHYQVKKVSLEQIFPQIDIEADKKQIFTRLESSLERVIFADSKLLTTVAAVTHRHTQVEKYYYEKIYGEIEHSFNKLKQQRSLTLRELLSPDMQNASPIELIEFISQIRDYLLQIQIRCNRDKKQAWLKEDAAQKSLIKLLNKSRDERSIVDAIPKALYLTLRAKLEAEICTQYNLYLTSLNAICSSYIDSLSRSAALLKRAALSIKSKCCIDLISLPVFTQLHKIDIDQQRRLLVKWSGHTINYFGSSSLTYEQMESNLLINIEPEVENLWLDFQLMYEEIIVKQCDRVKNFN